MRCGRGWAAVVVLAGLLTPGLARAGWWGFALFGKKAECPAPSYPKLNYLAPQYQRAKAHVHGPALSVYPVAPPAEGVILTYPCQTVDPAQLVTERPILR